MRFAILSRSTAALAVSLALAAPMRADPAHWPSLHGAHARGVGPGTPPITWDLTTGENVRFKVSLPGLAHASPVIWGDRIYVVTVTSAGPQPELRVGLYGDITPAKDQEIVHTWWLYAFDRATGTLVWKRELHRGTPATKRHIKATHANSTPTTDGEHIVVFLGSEGLHCLDRNGKRLAEGFWRARRRLLHDPGSAMGVRQLTGDRGRQGGGARRSTKKQFPCSARCRHG